MHLVRDNTYSIQCSYLYGSDVNGCGYVMVGVVNGVTELIGAIIRANTNEVERNIANINCYSAILAYELDQDNSINFRSFSVNMSIEFDNTFGQCPFLGKHA